MSAVLLMPLNAELCGWSVIAEILSNMFGDFNIEIIKRWAFGMF